MGRKVFYLLLCCCWGAFAGLAWAGGEIHSGETKSGNIANPSYMDSWTFDGQEGERVVIAFAEASGGTTYYKYIYLYPPGGGPVEASSGGYNAYLDAQLKVSGTYTIVLEDSGLNNSYAYNVSLVKGTGTEGALASGQTLNGALAPSGVKAYRFSGQAGERVNIGFAETSGGTSYYKYIYLYPPSGGSAEASSGGYNTLLDTQLQETGSYMIVVFDSGWNNSYNYNVSLVKWTDIAGAIISGQTLGGSLVPSAIKAYRFFGQVGERVAIGFAEALGGTAYYKYINLYPPNGGPVEASNGGYNTLLDTQLQETGSYIIVVFDSSLNNSYDYNITLAKTLGPFSSRDNRDGGSLVSGQTAGGTLVPSSVRGYYFYGQAGERALIGLAEASGGTSYYKYIYLYPPGGGPAETSSGGYNTLLDTQLKETGFYMIVVFDSGWNNSYDYNLSLLKIPATSPPGLYNPTPGDGSKAGRSGSLSWTPVTGATGYDVYFGGDISQALPQVGNNLPGASLPFSGLTAGRPFYWRVIAHTPSGDIAGPYWWFETASSPGLIPVLEQLLLVD